MCVKTTYKKCLEMYSNAQKPILGQPKRLLIYWWNKYIMKLNWNIYVYKQLSIFENFYTQTIEENYVYTFIHTTRNKQ